MILETEQDARAFVADMADAQALARLDALAAALREENERQNLVARATLDQMWLRHIADSAQLLTHVDSTAGVWLDLGTGAGFPGLVIAVIRPQTPVFLIESRRKRIEWLEEQAHALGLANCTVLGQRLEQVDTFPAAAISARAFAPLPRLIELSARFSTSDTRWVLPKGRSAAQEVESLPARLRKMFHVEQSVTDRDAGIIIGTGRPETK